MKFFKYCWNLCYATSKKIGLALFHLVFITLFCTLPHELGHAVAAKAFSYKVDHIMINFVSSSDFWFSFPFFGYEIRLGKVPLIFGQTHFGYTWTRGSRGSDLIITAAGLLVNLWLALLGWWGESKLKSKFWKKFFRWLKEYNLLTIIYNFLAVLWVPNCDVRRIFSLLFHKN